MQKPLIQRIQKSNQVAEAANHQEASPAVFNITNGEKEMQNSNIMALALALCNVEQGQAVKVPAMAGSNFHLAI